MKCFLLILTLALGLSCQKKSTDNKVSNNMHTDDVSSDTINKGLFKRTAPYVVISLKTDSTDAAGNKWQTIELKNERNEYFKSSGTGIISKIGDTVLIGKNESGYYMVFK